MSALPAMHSVALVDLEAVAKRRQALADAHHAAAAATVALLVATRGEPSSELVRALGDVRAVLLGAVEQLRTLRGVR